MCIIIYSPNGAIPRSHMERGLVTNPHGWGFMYPEKGKLRIWRGMTPREFWENWKHPRPKGAPVVWHARITSHGETNLENCHPFHVPGHGPLAVAHNGVIRHHADKQSPLSDTRLFIRDVLSQLPRGFLNEDAICRLIEAYIGYSKLVFMDGRGDVTILNEDLGHWRKGRWYSNCSYLPPAPPKSEPDVDEDPSWWSRYKLKAGRDWRVPGLS